jgi:predicted anti-sigma-YlaC factor YlaD
MHAVVMESLEEYLAGTLPPVLLRDIETHLGTCRMCREEIQGMREVSQLFGSLQTQETEAWSAAPGFYAKVMERVSQRKAAPGFANLFSLDLVFGRRLVFASLLTLAVLGGYLVSHETAIPVGPSPEAILAQQNAPAFETARAEDNMLVTLTAYEY